MATSSSFTSVVALHSRQSRLCFYRHVIVLFFFSSMVSALWHQVERSASRLVTVCNFEMWCMTGYWENANWKSIFLKPRGTSDDGSAGWTPSRTFETEEELRVLSHVNSANEKNALRLFLRPRVSSFSEKLTLEDK